MSKMCNLCPRKCNVDRREKLGFCKSKDALRISRVGLHEWEEPCISYGKGSGTIFFADVILAVSTARIMKYHRVLKVKM